MKFFQPTDLVAEDLKELENLADKYPACNFLNMLYLKALHKEEHEEYESQLKRTAIQVPNRKKLYAYITRETLTQTVTSFEKAIQESPETIPAVASIQEDEEHLPEESKAASDALKEAWNSHQEKVQDEDLKELEATILQEAIEAAAVYDIEELEKPNTEQEVEHTTEIEEIREPELVTPQPQEEEEQPVQEEEPEDFYAWLSQIEGSPSAPSTPKEQQTNKEPEEEQAPKVDEQLLNSLTNETNSLSLPSVSFYKAEDRARISLLEDESFVTETLARIYAQQGQRKKAIRAFEVLRLKYPEKSAYFANLIEEIKKEL